MNYILLLLSAIANRGVAEWLKAHAWKACKRETVSGVRIPSPLQQKTFARKFLLLEPAYKACFCGIVIKEKGLVKQVFVGTSSHLEITDPRGR